MKREVAINVNEPTCIAHKQIIRAMLNDFELSSLNQNFCFKFKIPDVEAFNSVKAEDLRKLRRAIQMCFKLTRENRKQHLRS